jgi:hypothetical protein
MSFLQLHRGQLILPERNIDVTPDPDPDSDSDKGITWKTDYYAKFPWRFRSMKRIEGLLDSHPILKGLSGKPFPDTHRPLCTKRSMSRISGQITGMHQTTMHSTSWLCTDEVQFLFAFLLRNQDSTSGVIHVLGPMITHKVALVYEVMPAILHDKVTEIEHHQYLYNLEGIQQYIDSRLDIFKHKFLVFACNIGEMHWVSTVVVNPFLLFDRYLNKGKEDGGRNGVLGDEDFAGWCVLNSTAR